MLKNYPVKNKNISYGIFDESKLPLIHNLLYTASTLYPRFNHWINFTFKQSLILGERKLLIAHNNHEAIGIALLKKTKNESKICSLFIKENHRKYGVGNDLIGLSLRILDSQDTFISVSDEKISELIPLLKSHNFYCYKSIEGLYKTEIKEHFFKIR